MSPFLGFDFYIYMYITSCLRNAQKLRGPIISNNNTYIIRIKLSLLIVENAELTSFLLLCSDILFFAINSLCTVGFNST